MCSKFVASFIKQTRGCLLVCCIHQFNIVWKDYFESSFQFSVTGSAEQINVDKYTLGGINSNQNWNQATIKLFTMADNFIRSLVRYSPFIWQTFDLLNMRILHLDWRWIFTIESLLYETFAWIIIDEHHTETFSEFLYYSGKLNCYVLKYLPWLNKSSQNFKLCSNSR